MKILRRPEELALHLADLARRLKEVMLQVYQQEEDTGKVHEQLAKLRQVLMPQLTIEAFADMVVQTICYGLFAAKCRAVDQPLLSGQFAPSLAKISPWLYYLFEELAVGFDKRFGETVDQLVAVLNRVDIAAILANFGKRTGQEDPVVHFYETFLAHYDAQLREVRGVYYTPEPVVSYIVRSVDEVLKEKFGLKLGLADNSTLLSPFGRGAGGEGLIHQVQILDPATGTGTFLLGEVLGVRVSFTKSKFWIPLRARAPSYMRWSPRFMNASGRIRGCGPIMWRNIYCHASMVLNY